MAAALKETSGTLEKYRRGWSALLNATHEFASLERPAKSEIARFKELFYTLCLKGNDQELRIIANTLAFNPYVPRSIVYLLSLCRPKIAEQMLLLSPVLKPRDLLAIIGKAGTRHAALVARRGDINLDVVRSILALDQENRALASILKLNSGLKTNREVQALLTKPTTRAVDDINTTDQLERETDASKELLKLAAKGGKLGREHGERPVKEHSLPESDGFKLLQYARERQSDAFAWRIERRCKLPTAYTSDLIAKKDAGGLATLLRSLEIPKVQAARILLLLTPALGRDPKVLNQVLDMYVKLNLEECRSFLKTRGADFDAGWSMTTERMRLIRKEAMRSGSPQTQAPAAVPTREHSVSLQEAAN